jgi:hypothetical protein
MKTLSRIFAFILLAIIGIVTFVSCVTKFGTNYKYDQQIGDPKVPRYATFKHGESPFRHALITLRKNGGDCEITILHSGPGQTPIPGYCKNLGPVNLKTDRVIKSKTAYNTVGQPAANDPNVTWHVLSNSQQDVNAVLQTLNP